MSYVDLITKKKQYKYSANICFDIKDEEKLSGFIPNITTTEILKEYLFDIINHSSKIHSRILYGSYGTGKSHLLTVISDILGHYNTDGNGIDEFLNSISKYDNKLSESIKRFVNEEKPYLIVPIYTNFDEFDKCITFSLKKELEQKGIDICFKSYFDDAFRLVENWQNGSESSERLNEICKKKNVSISDLCVGLQNYDKSSEKIFASIFKSMTYGAEFVSNAGDMLENIALANEKIKKLYSGIVFVFDEFGRYVEDAGEKIKVKDIQNLAEFCDHSDYNDHIVLVSHKQLSLYTDKMERTLSEEWKKVEGRFKATSINIKYDQCLSLISHVIPKTNKWYDFKLKFENKLNDIYMQAYDFKGFMLPPESEVVNPFEGGFPLHPITLYSLDRLSKKVAQNERTFFTYLASDEENALFSQLKELDDNEFHFIGLDCIYDYFEENIKAYGSDAKDIYKKFQVAINKIGNITEKTTEIKIIKAIAVIYIINDFNTLSADVRTLTNVIDVEDTHIIESIKYLEENKIIKFMRQYGYYDFLDSSIYDFDSMIEEKILSVTDDMAITTLNDEFSDFVVLPYEYNLIYHMNRVLLPVFALKEDISKKSFCRTLPKYYDGAIAFILDKQYTFEEYNKIESIPDRTIAIINKDELRILYEIKRYVAIKYFYSIRSELMKDDPTVEQELLLYLEEQKSVVSDIIMSWKNVSNDKIAVMYDRNICDVHNENELAALASKMMNDSFPKTIIVNNDLVNKNNLSGAMRQARSKALSYIMNDDNILENCTVLSPEHTIIRSVLSKNGFYSEENIHKLNRLPSGEVSGFYIQDEIQKYIDNCKNGRVVLNDLYDVLKSEPYGLRDGYIAVILAYEFRKFENISIYFHGSEHDYCEEELLKALLKPNDYSFYISDWNVSQEKYITCLEELFDSYRDKTTKNRLKELLMAMNKHFVSISKAARTTNHYVSETTKQYRDIMSVTYKDYNKFFFDVLPQIDRDYQTLVMSLVNVLKELEGVHKLQLDSIESSLLKSLSIESNKSIAEELKQLYENNWKDKKHITFDYQTNAFLEYVSTMDFSSSNYKVIEELGKIITGFEIEFWSDSKIDEFCDELLSIVDVLNGYELNDSIGDDEIKITINSGNDIEKITQFNKTELTGMSQIMFNKMKSTLDNFGASITYEEKLQVLARLFSEMM